MGEEAEQELLRRVAEGDQEAFCRIFERWQKPLFGFAYRLVGSASAAEDITQECFLALLKSAGRFDHRRARLITYAYAIVRNLACKYFRQCEPGLDEEEVQALVVRETAADRVLRDELSAVVAQAIASLPSGQRETLVLFEYEDLTVEEIASVLRIDPGAVKVRLHRARSKLKSLLAGYVGAREGSCR